MGTLGIQMIACVAGVFLASAQMRANSRKRTCKTAGYAGKTDKDPNNALDPNNSEVQLIGLSLILRGV